MYPDKYRFIAVLEYTDTGTIGVYFPDLPGCISTADSADEAAENAKEALSLHIYGMEEDNEEIPAPSDLKDIVLESNEMPLYVEVYMKPFREKMRKRFVKKTLSVPAWINAMAEEQGINFSAVLQKALKEELGVNE